MKILHVSSAKTWRGGEQQIIHLVEGLSRKGIENIIFCPEDTPLHSHNSDGAKFIGYRKLSSFNPLVSWKLKEIAEAENIDLIHVHDSHSHNYFLTANAMGLSLPGILTRRVDFIPRSKRKYNHPSIKRIICVSDHIKNILSDIIVNKERLLTLRDCIDINETVKQDSLHSFLNLSPSVKIIANVSALADHKDYPTFLHTARRVLEETDQEVAFVIMGGDAGEQTRIEAKLEDLNLKGHVHLTGHINNPQRYFDSIAIFLFTSKEEGLGSVLLEAMNYGIPIVATKGGGVPEIIRDDINGLLCDIGNDKCLAGKVNLLLTNAATRQKIVDGAYEEVKKFSVDKMAEKTIEIYWDVIADHP